MEDSSLHRQVTAYILFSEGAHIWRTVFCTGRSHLTVYSVKVPTCEGKFFLQAGHSSPYYCLWRSVFCTGRSHPPLFSVKVPTCGGKIIAQAGHSSLFILFYSVTVQFCAVKNAIICFYPGDLFNLFGCQLTTTVHAFDVQAGTIQSPNYPFYYPPNTDCVWRLSVPGPASLRLTFQTLDLHPTDLIEVR